MKTFITKDPNIHWEDTGQIKVHNFPPSPSTFSYITRTYVEHRKYQFGSIQVDGEPIYFHQLSDEQLALAMILGNAQNALAKTLPREDFILEEAPF